MVELLVVMAILGILTALVLPIIGKASGQARRTTCLNNLRQINLGLRMYSDDASDTSPRTPNAPGSPPLNKWTGYRRLIMNQVGQQTRLFACPADTFYFEWRSGIYVPKSSHEQTNSDFSSY